MDGIARCQYKDVCLVVLALQRCMTMLEILNISVPWTFPTLK